MVFSIPSDSHLLSLMEEADRQTLRDTELAKALEHVSSKQENKKALLVKMLLMAGKIDAAFTAAGKTRALGWSYGESAAEILGSLAECYSLIGEEGKGRSMIDEYRNEKFNRHSAFRGELDSIIASSGLLREGHR